MKNSKQKFFSDDNNSSILVRTNRTSGLTIALKMCGNHAKIATTLLGKGEKFKHKAGIFEALHRLEIQNKFIVIPIEDHKGSGMDAEQKLEYVMDQLMPFLG